ncbi:MAG: RibD family protein [Bacteroidota bacterium]
MENTEAYHTPLRQDQLLESLWRTLLLLKKRMRTVDVPPAYLMLEFGENEQLSFDTPLLPSVGSKQLWIGLSDQATPREDTACAQVDNLYSIRVSNIGTLSQQEWTLLQSYLAYCFLPLRAHRLQRAIAVSHFAQTLDGKIATQTGDSKWIGNPENLLHAHRMRALCDGIMIGTRTLSNDRPSLTVRLVQGDNPRRIVISSSARDFSSLINSCVDPVLVLGSEPKTSEKHLDYKYLPSSNGHISCEDILCCLHQEGIHSVYVEGGSETTSNFLKDQMLDVMQFHFSPQIFGSGISGIVLPEIAQVKEAVRFASFTFLQVGDSYMFVGEPER